MKPTVGRIVHYTSFGTPGGEYGQECRAAIVTCANDHTIGLAILNPTGMFFNDEIYEGKYSTDGGTWHWPERA
jgi:hypothetical protein